MHYPTLSKLREYRMSMPLPSGGICRSQDARTIRDNQVSDACNVWWKDGLLCSRPAVAPASSFSLNGLCEEGDEITELRLCHEETVRGNEPNTQLLVTLKKADLTKSVGMFRVNGNGQILSDNPLWIDALDEDENVVYIEAGGDDGVPMLMSRTLLHEQIGNVTRVRLPYVPLLAMRAQGDKQHIPAEIGGVPFEARNLLTDAFRVEYVVTENGVFFHLPPKLSLDGLLTVTCTTVSGDTVVHQVTLEGTSVCHETEASDEDNLRLYYSHVTHCFCFLDSSDHPQDMSLYPYVTLEARFLPSDMAADSENLINQMRFGTWFGGNRSGLTGGTRLFLSGHPAHPHLVHYSALNNPTYFPENSYFYVGSASDPVTAFGKQGHLLVIFKKHEIYYVDYTATPLNADEAMEGGVVDAETQSASFPLTPLSVGVGCDCPQSLALCGNRLVWCTSDGNVYTLLNSNAYSQCNVRAIGTPIAPLLRQCAPTVWQQACGWYADERYMLVAGEQMFVLDLVDRSVDSEPAWYRFHFPCSFLGGSTNGNAFYLLSRLCDDTIDQLVTYTPHENASDRVRLLVGGTVKENTLSIESFFKTKEWDFARPEHYKNVRLLTLSGEGRGMKHLKIRCSDEQGDNRDEVSVSAGFDTVVRFFPACRHIRRFGICVSSKGTVRYDGISLLYSLYHR